MRQNILAWVRRALQAYETTT